MLKIINNIYYYAWSLVTWVPLWGSLGGSVCWWPCYHLWITQGMCQEALEMERSNGGEKTESKCRWKKKDHDSVVQAWTSCRVQVSFLAPSVALEWAATASSAMAASTGCTRNAVGSRLDKGPWLQMYTVSGNCMPWTADHRGKSVGPDKLEVVASFCYLGDMLSGGCELLTTTCLKTAWKKLKELLPVLSSHHFSFKARGCVYSSYVQSAMLHASETWPLTKPNLQNLRQNDRAMIRQIWMSSHKTLFVCLCWGFTAQSTQWGHVECGQFT